MLSLYINNCSIIIFCLYIFSPLYAYILSCECTPSISQNNPNTNICENDEFKNKKESNSNKNILTLENLNTITKKLLLDENLLLRKKMILKNENMNYIEYKISIYKENKHLRLQEISKIMAINYMMCNKILDLLENNKLLRENYLLQIQNRKQYLNYSKAKNEIENPEKENNIISENLLDLNSDRKRLIEQMKCISHENLEILENHYNIKNNNMK